MKAGVIAAAIAALAGCSSGGSTPTSTTSSSPAATTTRSASASVAASGGLRRFYRQHLHWSDCGSGFQCGRLVVPVDYSKPGGATLRVAVIRKPATGTARGSLIVNPGGPGASGVDFVRGSAGDFAGVRPNYNLVSFDPRGVGRSRPVRCLSGPQLDAFVAVDPTPDDAGEYTELVRSSRSFANACFRRNGNYLEHVGTIDAARDMDVLRAVLGDRRLTFYGGSYGTYLGAKYAQLFPHRIRAMVLDGALDPRQSTSAENEVQAEGFETDLDDFLASCAKTTSCPFPSSDPGAGLDRLQARLDAHPLTVGNRRLGPGEFFEGLALGLYSTSYWSSLRRALGDAENGDGRLLLAFSDALTERHSDGTYANLIESNLAINCIDRPSSRQVSAYNANARTFAREAPHFGAPIAYGSLPCAFWRVPPVEQAHAVKAPGAPPILVIGTTRDPATPYVWAKALARQLSSGVLMTYDSDGHTAYSHGNSCVVSAVNAYLNRRVVPPAGLRCG